MNIKEIINRNEMLPFSTNEMEFVVKHYIKEKTGKKIDINLNKSSSWINVFPQQSYINQVNKLTVAFAYACVQLRKL